MRRKTPGNVDKDELIAGKIAVLERTDPERVIAALEPFVGDRRKARLLDVIGKRLESVQVIFESPHDPHNGAAVLRSCEAFGVQFIHVVETRERFLAAQSVARGSEKWVDVIAHAAATTAIEKKPDDADLLEKAVQSALASGARTADIAEAGAKRLSTTEMGDAVLIALDKVSAKEAA